jgi:acetoin utilization deacetylase AcuC-like enzyme
VNIFYSPAYVGSAYAFETTRKARWVAESLANSPLPGLRLQEPPALTEEQVVQVHDREYVEAVKTGVPRYLAQSQGFPWDPGLWPMVLSSNGGAVAACLDALENGIAGSLSSGLHHARRDSGAGFCTFNGLVVAARAALAAGAQSVLILDLDAHCGGGTASLIADDPHIWQADVGVDSFDYYRVAPAATGRIAFRFVESSSRYLATVEDLLLGLAERAPHFDLCLYNAGMDPFESCDTGGLLGITRDVLAERERLAFAWCSEHCSAVAFVLAGGYIGTGLDAAGLVGLHRLTLSAAASCRTPTGFDPGKDATQAA